VSNLESLYSFLQQEEVGQEIISCKIIYVDMVNDLIAAILLSQIIYWHLPSKQGKSKLRVRKEGKYWLAKNRQDWYSEIRITPKQYDRAIKILEEKEIIEVKNSMFQAMRTPFIRIKEREFMKLYRKTIEQKQNAVLTKGENRYYLNDNTDIPQKVIPITENTTKNTSKTIILHDLSELNDVYVSEYLRIMSSYGLKHKRISNENMSYIEECISLLQDYDVELETWGEEVHNHFKSLPTGNDGDILAFLSAGKRHLEIDFMFELGYMCY